MATAVTEKVEVVLDSRSHPGERSYPMILNEREQRLEHWPGTECEAVLRGSRYLCWHQDRLTWAHLRMRKVWRGMLAYGCPSADVLEISATRRAELVRETERRLAAAERMVTG